MRRRHRRRGLASAGWPLTTVYDSVPILLLLLLLLLGYSTGWLAGLAARMPPALVCL